MLPDLHIIPGHQKKLFSATKPLQKGFQVIPEGESQILKKKTTNVHFDEKIANTVINGFILTTNIYGNPSDADILVFIN